MGEFERAIASYKQAVELRPDHALVYGNMALAFIKWGHLADAAECYCSAVRLDPRAAKTRHNLGVVLTAMGSVDEALEQHRILLNLDRELAAKLYELITKKSAVKR